MAINSSPPVSGALTAKIAAAGEMKGKPPAFAPGTPVFPPERLPLPPRRGGLPPNTPAAAAADAAVLQSAARSPLPQGAIRDAAATDARGDLPENLPFAAGNLPGPVEATAATSETTKLAPSAPFSRPRPKVTVPTQLATAIPLQAQLPLPISPPPEAASVTGIAEAAAAPAIIQLDAAGTLALPFTQSGGPVAATASAFRPTATAASALAITADEAAGANEVPGATDPQSLQATGFKPSAPGKPAISTDTQDTDARPHTAAAPVDGDSSTTDAGILSLNVAPAHLASTPATAAPPPVQTPVGTAGWSEEVSTHVVWMAHQGLSSASLRLQPEHLGPLEVKISLHDSTATVWFGATEPETRTALQAALPQLKEMFAAQGMTLTDAGVSHEPPRDSQVPRPAPPSANPAEPAVLESSPALRPRRGLVDTYA